MPENPRPAHPKPRRWNSLLRAAKIEYIHEPFQEVFKDKVFLREQWRHHRSWRRHLPGLAGVRVAIVLSPILAFFTLEAFTVCAYHTWLEQKGAPSFYEHADVGYWQVFNLTSFALSLLMVFRTNSSYARWWEARTVWGGILNVTRNLVRKATAYFPPGADKEIATVVRWTACLPYLLQAHLSGQSTMPLEVPGDPQCGWAAVRQLLLPHELAWLGRAKQPCLCAAEVLTMVVADTMDSYQAATTDQLIVDYTNYVGACERIQRTPIPLPYTRHLSRFMTTWLLFLPFGLWPILGWAVPGVSCVVAYLLVGTENIGVQLEEPFAIIFMGQIADSCRDSIAEIVETAKGTRAMMQNARHVTKMPASGGLGGPANGTAEV